MARKFGSGEQVKIADFEHANWQDAGDAHRRLQHGLMPSPGIALPDSNEGIILVKNIDRDLPRFSVLGLPINDTIAQPTGSIQQAIDFQNQIALRGEVPSTTTSGRFCILQVDARANEVVPAMLSGVTQVRINVTAITDQFADVETDPLVDQTKWLKTGGSGAAQLIYQPEILGEQWAVVRMSNKPPGELKLVRYDYLPAAFGGLSGRYPAGALAESYGNAPSDRFTNRRMYQRTCNVWKFNDSESWGYGTGDFSVSTEPNIQVMNPYDLPLMNGYAWVTPINPSKSQYVVTQPICPNPWGACDLAGAPSLYSGGAFVLRHDTRKLMHGVYASVNGFPTGNNGSWAINYGDSIMLPFPGTYKITMGAQVHYLPTGFAPYQEYNTSDASSGASHTHTYKGYSTPVVSLKLLKNFEPGTSIPTFGASTELPEVLTIHIPPGGPTSPGSGSRFLNEKTFHIENDSNAWHGQPHTRLTIAAHCYLDTSCVGYDVATHGIEIDYVWMSIEPLPQNPGEFGGGAQQFPSGYNWPSLTDFVWYGGGPEPDNIDEDGAVV